MRFNKNFKFRNRVHYAKFDKFYQNVYANGAVSDSNTVALGAYNDETDRENFFNQTDLLFNLNTGPIKHNIITGLEVSRQVTKQLRQQSGLLLVQAL